MGVDLKRVTWVSVVAYAHVVLVYNMVGFLLRPILRVGAREAWLTALVAATVFVMVLHVSYTREDAEET